jgi:hypothetical protein
MGCSREVWKSLVSNQRRQGMNAGRMPCGPAQLVWSLIEELSRHVSLKITTYIVARSLI